MKSLATLVIIVLFSSILFAQNAVDAVRKQERIAALDETFSNYTLFSINTNKLNQLKRDENLLTINLSPDTHQDWNIVLEPNDLRAPSYQSVLTTDTGTQIQNIEVHTYKGYVNGDIDRPVRLTIKDGHVSGYIKDDSEMFFIEPATQFAKNSNSDDLILYRAADIIDPVNLTCEATHFEDGMEMVENNGVLKSGDAGCITLELATEADYEYYALHGDDANELILSILNEVEGVYNTTFGLNIDVVYQSLYTIQNDPFPDSVSTSGFILSQFRNHWEANMDHIDRDLAHMWTGKQMDGVSIGIAYTGTVCSSRTFAYGVSQNIGSFAYGRFVLTAHEIGHNFGAQHSDSEGCSSTGSIMCSGVQLGAFYFSESEREAINTKLSSPESCFAGGVVPGGLQATPTCAAVELTWNGTEADNYEVRLRPVGSDEWVIYDALGNTLSLENLNAPEYEFQVKNGCNPAFSASEFFTPTQSVTLALSVFLEGAYNPITDLMNTNLNDLELLPGQTNNSNAIQPYNVAPWNYYGTEGQGWNEADYQTIEEENGGRKIVDWVLVSFRTSPFPEDQVLRAAALLLEDGSVVFPDENLIPSFNNSSLYIIIEHRNHMGIMTPQLVDTDENCALAYDFTTNNSYVPQEGIGFGQAANNNRWLMYAGDGNQATDEMSYDITGSDKSKWLPDNGDFLRYSDVDYNLDGDVNGSDKAVWEINNGKSSRVLKSY